MNTIRNGHLPVIAVLFSLIFIPRADAHEPLPVVKIPGSPFWNTILRQANVGPQVTFSGNSIYPILNPGKDIFPNHSHELLCSSGTLFIHIRGTGLLYRAEETATGDSIVFIRQDKTRHFGYNLNAYSFTVGDRIYNLGGYGFWKWNGQLRSFNGKMREWEIVPLDREIVTSKDSPNSFCWNNGKKGQLFILQSFRENEAVRNEPFRTVDSVYQLDLNTGNWSTVGRQTEVLRKFLNQQTVLAEMDSGLLVNNRGVIQYFDMLENRVLTLRDVKVKAELQVALLDTYNWYVHGKLYYGDPRTGSIDSLALDKRMFADTGNTVFEAGHSDNMALWLLPPMILIAGLAYLSFMRRVEKHADQGNHEKEEGGSAVKPVVLSSPHLQQAVFDEVELSLLKCLVQNMQLKGSRTGTHEINRVLGVASKTMDMQKRKRSDVIRSVNRKYQLLHPDRASDLILKDKSELDGRLSEYYISQSELETVMSYIHG